jgi:hypothetical protein
VSSEELLKDSRVWAATGATASPSDTGVDSIAAEACAALGGSVGAAVMRRNDLDVLDSTLTIRAVVFDAHIGKMDVAIDDGEVATCGPFGNIPSGGVCVTLGTSAIAIHVAEEALVVALELVVQGHSSDGRTTVSQPVGRVKVRSI